MTSLSELREEIDCLDEALMDVLGKRLEVCRRVALLKRSQQIPMMQSARLQEVRGRCHALGAARGLNPTLIDAVYDAVFEESCRIETAIIEGTAHGERE